MYDIFSRQIISQMQMEKEKQNYDFENLQSQLDKSHGQITRMQKERETIQLEIDRLQDKYEKAQVRIFYDQLTLFRDLNFFGQKF